MGRFVLKFGEIDRARVTLAGGKAANLGELGRIQGVRVPQGFCVTTNAFQRIVEETPAFDSALDRLSRLQPDAHESNSTLSGEIRHAIETTDIPQPVAAEILLAIAGLGEQTACAVRSSATAEDLPSASFAGQQDSYLNIVGPQAILRHISRCWASLFNDRAVSYRIHHGLDHRKVHMAVIVQRMIHPTASGVLFTADPVTGNRHVSSVEAVAGLGENLVSGLVNPDAWNVRGDSIISREFATSKPDIHGTPASGARKHASAPARQKQPVLTDMQVVKLVQLGRRIEAHFGRPQDIEWCLANDEFQVVQSRPITTLFPIPPTDDQENHVYISVGHQQMMTDAMKPLGLSVWQLTTRRPMCEAGGRLFVDVTGILGSGATRPGFMDMIGRSDPLIRDALQTVLDRGDFVPSRPGKPSGDALPGASPTTIATDAAIVAGLIERNQQSIATLKREIRDKTGPALLDFILSDLKTLQRLMGDPQSHQAIMAGMEAAWWLNDHLHHWLGEKNAADTLSQSSPNNITSEMGLALLDVADVIRPHPDVVAFLESVDDETFLNELPELAGGQESRNAIAGWLDAYGMRCAGEIDITTPRWIERPDMLVPALLGNIRNFAPGAGKHRFEQGLTAAREKTLDITDRLRLLPDGEQKAEETRRMIDRVRTFGGYREYPKYSMICRYYVYKLAMLDEADRLVQAHVLREREDMFYLTFQELEEVVGTSKVDHQTIRQRKDAFRSYQALTPPRVLTSEGEAVAGSYQREDMPDGALIGLPVSAGTIEGRARVILDMAETELAPGDILVTTYTDPSWTPLFVAIKGLVTEVGGLMTHGAVIAREYGLPAVVGVENATQLIRDGQRIRVHGTEGFIELLPSRCEGNRQPTGSSGT